MAGFGNTTVYADNVDFTGNQVVTPQITTDGQLLIGSTAFPNIRAGVLTSSGGTVTITNGAGSINLDVSGSHVGETITGTTGGALSPTAGNWNILGTSTAAGTTPVQTSGTGSTLTVQVQKAQSIASTNATNVGLAAFNSSQFSVDANGFVSATGGGIGLTLTGTSGGPLSPTAGNWNILGATHAAGTVPVSVVGSGSTETVTVQFAQAIAATDATKVGLANFNSADFSVDANGFVSAGSTGFIRTITGTSGGAESPAAGGNFNILGGTAAAGTTPVVVAGTANTETVKVQISQAIASTDATKVGLASFNSADFTVDANGFVTSTGAGSSITIAGDSGSISGGSLTIYAHNAVALCGATVSFVNSGTTSTLNVSTGSNTMVGGGAGGTAITSAAFCTFFGTNAGAVLTSGNTNCGVGYNALAAVTSGPGNTAIGTGTLPVTQTSSSNTAIGNDSLNAYLNGTGLNTAVGVSSLGSLTTGSYNTALGYQAGDPYTSSESSNIVIGYGVGTAADNNTIRIGVQGSGINQQNKCFIAGIEGVSVSNLNYVTINTSTGQLGSVASITSSISITGNTGGALTGSAFTFTGGTTGLTFSGSGTTETLTGTLIVGNGGTGLATTTAYGLITGGTTATGNFQNAGTGTSGQVYLSGGSAALGTWTTTTPQVTVYTSGSGTYTTPTGALYLIVEMVGGGGGGGGSGTSSGAATGGGNSTFGTSLLTCNGGALGGITQAIGAGGTATGGDINLSGGNGAAGLTSVTNAAGGSGGISFYGGSGTAGQATGGPGTNAQANTGGGGGGAGTVTVPSGSGGGAGGYLRKLISSPSATYSYAVGAGGSGGSLGTGGAAGGTGAAGNIIVTAYFV